jgi:glycerophosphoryl diester phosphodiesterase
VVRSERSPVLVSAHRPEDLEAALSLGVDYVELDVRQLADGSFVVAHDDGDPHAHVLDDVLARLVERAGAHVDLKVESHDGSVEVDVTRRVLAVLDTDAVVITTESVVGVRAVRDWADAEGLELRVGLSVGRPVHRLPLHGQVRVRVAELLSTSVRDSRANVVVARHTLARLGMAWIARRRGLPLLVWTVDGEASLRYWLRPGRAWMVTTNQPEIALRLRGSGT